MKKTVIAVLSILLMLAAFTGCDPNNEDQTISTAEWQYYNDDADKSSEYVDVDSVAVAADGEYELEISFADGKYALKVDGMTLKSDIAPVAGETAGKIQGLYFGLNNNGTAYSATFTAPVVTADGKTVENVPALKNISTDTSATAGWVNSRDGKATIKVAEDKKSVTITSTADAADYQGLELRADTLMPEAVTSWSVKTTVKVDTSIFDTANAGVGFWVEAADATGASDGFWHVIRLNSTVTAEAAE